HLGAPEFADFIELAETYEHVRLDTTMVFTPFFDRDAPVPDALLPRLAELREKVLLGSDFPNIPYEYAAQVDGLVRLTDRCSAIDDDWLRAVLWGNAAALFGA